GALGRAPAEGAVPPTPPSTAPSFRFWMGEAGGPVPSPGVSTPPAPTAQIMKASSGSALCPTWIRTPATLPSSQMTNVPLSEAIQDYLKTVYKLQAAEGRVTIGAVAKDQRVSPASASAMVKKLAAL